MTFAGETLDLARCASLYLPKKSPRAVQNVNVHSTRNFVTSLTCSS